MNMLETERLIIRSHIEADWQDLYEYLSLEQTYVFEPGKPISESEARQITADRAQGKDFLAVVLKCMHKVIGHLYFHHTEPGEYLTWELGYIFNPEFHNRGYCTEASRSIIVYAFKTLHAHKVVAYCNPLNPASWKVLEKCGMRREGHFLQKAFFRRDVNGRPVWHDCYAYGILADRLH